MHSIALFFDVFALQMHYVLWVYELFSKNSAKVHLLFHFLRKNQKKQKYILQTLVVYAIIKNIVISENKCTFALLKDFLRLQAKNKQYAVQLTNLQMHCQCT